MPPPKAIGIGRVLFLLILTKFSVQLLAGPSRIPPPKMARFGLPYETEPEVIINAKEQIENF